MRNREFRQSHVVLGALWLASGLAMVACSKGDTVNTQNTPGKPVVSCGSLSAAEAADLFTARVEHFGSVGLAALSGLENSRSAARLLTFGDTPIMDVFVAEGQADLHDGLIDLQGDQLIEANVESTTPSSVTFLLDPETMCEGTAPMATPVLATGGSSATASTVSDIDPNCVATRKAHPIRIRVSRIGCAEAGDNIAIEVLLDPAATRVLTAELYAERAEVELDLGAFLKASFSTSSSTPAPMVGAGGMPPTSTRTEKPIVSSAVGVLRGSVSLSGSSQASGRVSVAQAIDFTTAGEVPERFRIAAGTDVVTFAADGSTKKIQANVKAGAFDANIAFPDFIRSFFDLYTTTAGTTQPPVDLHLSGITAGIVFDGATDTVTADSIQIVDNAATATQAGRTLLSFSATGADQTALGAVFAGKVDDSLDINLANGLAVDIQYGLEPVMSLIETPANFLANDKLSLLAGSGTGLTLWQDATPNDLAVTSSQAGELLRVNTGSLEMRSSVWPADTVAVQPGQCLSRTVTSQAGHHDLLDDFTQGACSR